MGQFTNSTHHGPDYEEAKSLQNFLSDMLGRLSLNNSNINLSFNNDFPIHELEALNLDLSHNYSSPIEEMSSISSPQSQFPQEIGTGKTPSERYKKV